MEFAQFFWYSLLSEKQAPLMYDLFYDWGFEVCSHVAPEKVHARDACLECLTGLFVKASRLRVRVHFKCVRNVIPEDKKKWAIAFLPFTDETVYVDLYKCNKDVISFAMSMLDMRELRVKKVNLFGNVVECENFIYDNELHMFGEGAGLYVLLILRFVLLETMRSQDPAGQRRKIAQALDASKVCAPFLYAKYLNRILEKQDYEDLSTFSCNMLQLYIDKIEGK